MPKIGDPGKPLQLQPFWQTTGGEHRLYLGDVCERQLPAMSVQCCVTSPPYWGLRDYGTGQWVGGNESCDHKPHARPWAERPRGPSCPSADHVDAGNKTYRSVCGKCGAKRIDRQIGSEPTPGEYVAKMVLVFREVHRVLRDDGVLWLNLGSSYCSGSQPDRLRDIFDRALSSYLGGGSSSFRLGDERLGSSSLSTGGSGSRPAPLSVGGASDRTPVSRPNASPSLGSSDSVRRQRTEQSSPAKPGRVQTSPPAPSQQLAAQGQPKQRLSSSQPRAASDPAAKASASLTEQRSSSHDAQQFARSLGCTSDTSSTERLSVGRTQDKEPSFSACQSPHCKGLGRCGLCWASLSIPYHKPGDLVNIPHLTALALQADGWILRSDLPWVKRSAMPESVQNRPCKALEYVFMFVKRSHYYFDMEAVRKAGDGWGKSGNKERKHGIDVGCPGGTDSDLGRGIPWEGSGRSFRNADLWFDSVDKPHGLTWVDDELVGLDVTSEGYGGAHFATFPSGLVRPLIKASTSEHGACAKCGTPWRRVVEKRKLTRERPNDYVKRTGAAGTGNSCANSVAGVKTTTLGWEPGCECCGELVKRRIVVEKSRRRNDGGDRNAPGDCGASEREEGDKETTITEYVSDLPLEQHPVRPCVVLDPFIGSGTTSVVAVELGLHSIGIDLSAKYLAENAVERIKGKLLNVPATAKLVPRAAAKAVMVGRKV